MLFIMFCTQILLIYKIHIQNINKILGYWFYCFQVALKREQKKICSNKFTEAWIVQKLKYLCFDHYLHSQRKINALPKIYFHWFINCIKIYMLLNHMISFVVWSQLTLLFLFENLQYGFYNFRKILDFHDFYKCFSLFRFILPPIPVFSPSYICSAFAFELSELLRENSTESHPSQLQRFKKF